MSDALMVVCDEKHPHFGCTGYLTGDQDRLDDECECFYNSETGQRELCKKHDAEEKEAALLIQKLSKAMAAPRGKKK